MKAKAEKICKRYTGPRERRWLKRQTARARRRSEKPDPEDGATRLRELTHGWSG
jgi:hypothetical protein